MPTEGIPCVIVGGKLVVKEGEFQKGVWAGQPIRYPLEDRGRFERGSVAKWVDNFSINTVGVSLEAAGSDGDVVKMHHDMATKGAN